ncbi:OmpA/MotB family protein [Isachenkonia alkalipeptolytica]|uniref:OmpA-like domain-containing protein n=1 Tax=Isachenkonia alkalipeptolytica TaxID=2565777 RepID=A0AA43XNG0_9CLOT|nr:flagellar motor protein MotB [Isachenkonia alkalipeptolytica]NBG89631.1 hypothetical protein [Isachenkonia alkalipeptolytica]
MIKFDRDRESQEEQDYGSTWLITYSDMVTIILCFFIIFFMVNAEELTVLSHLNEDLTEEVEEMATEVEEKSATVDHLSDENLRLEEEKQDLLASLENLQSELQEAKAGEMSSLSFVQYLQEKEMMDLVEIIENERGLAIRFSDQVLFDSGEAAVNREGLELLKETAVTLKEMELDNHMIIEGHTDDVPTNPERYPSNWELSLDRAMGVARFLIDEKGFSEHRISVSGYGETRPIASNDDAEGRAKNRRIEIVILQ